MSNSSSGSELAAKDAKIRELEAALIAVVRAQNPKWYEQAVKDLSTKLLATERRASARQQELQTVQVALRECQEGREAHAAELEALKAKHADECNTLVTAHQTAVHEAKEDAQRYDALRVQLQSVNTIQHDAIRKFQEEGSQLIAQRKELRNKVKSLEDLLEEEKAAKQALVKAHADTEARLSQVQGVCTQLLGDKESLGRQIEAEKKKLQSTVAEHKAEVTATKASIATTKADLDAQKAICGTLTERLADVERQHAQLVEDHESSKAQVAHLDSECIRLLEERNRAHRERDQALAHRANYKQRLASLSAEYDDIRSTIPQLVAEQKATAEELDVLRSRLANQDELRDANALTAERTRERDVALVLVASALRDRNSEHSQRVALQETLEAERTAHQEAIRALPTAAALKNLRASTSTLRQHVAILETDKKYIEGDLKVAQDRVQILEEQLLLSTHDIESLKSKICPKPEDHNVKRTGTGTAEESSRLYDDLFMVRGSLQSQLDNAIAERDTATVMLRTAHTNLAKVTQERDEALKLRSIVDGVEKVVEVHEKANGIGRTSEQALALIRARAWKQPTGSVSTAGASSTGSLSLSARVQAGLARADARLAAAIVKANSNAAALTHAQARIHVFEQEHDNLPEIFAQKDAALEKSSADIKGFKAMIRSLEADNRRLDALQKDYWNKLMNLHKSVGARHVRVKKPWLETRAVAGEKRPQPAHDGPSSGSPPKRPRL
ncbi:hypothetical protein EXIGLDRAFT_839611 [Exidia glandulosa HHB12029]|uniref:Uncharacterized protein n=1 Tax=Exidia glandulosa HHB12029 TaxID=1314781 RepID=A0A165EWZ5_EXIGL|nr:hypothetical protein EXIGLDRAFT_839611 [Exidia glandulosa HHB12029]